ncbi:MAG: hypothetical protein ACI8TX_003133 [Hyphomicrobiaceae bacterium]|jgi:hypothetical protein
MNDLRLIEILRRIEAFDKISAATAGRVELAVKLTEEEHGA